MSATFPVRRYSDCTTSGHSLTCPIPEGFDANYVVGAEYVTTDDGTGLVHQSPAFGEIDRQIARENGLPILNPVGPDGTFLPVVGWLAGQHVRDTNHEINDETRTPRDPHSALRLHPLSAALLALRDRTDLLGEAQLVYRNESVQREDARGELDHRLAPFVHSRWSNGRVARQQRRLGAFSRPLLGHAAADMALRRRAPHVRRVARRAVRNSLART